VALHDLVGLEALGALDPALAARTAVAERSASALDVHLGASLGVVDGLLGAGYVRLLSGADAPAALHAATARGEWAFGEDRFDLALLARPGPTNRVSLTIRALPVPSGEWMRLRVEEPTEYAQRKVEAAERLVGLVERAFLPGLGWTVRSTHVATPATYARYLGTPSNFGLAAVPANAGPGRPNARLPIRGLVIPSFSHGMVPALVAGLQAVDRLLDGRVMRGAFRPPRTRTKESRP
jgi:hypothetical protein